VARITYIEFNGREHVVDVEPGLSVMEGAKKNEIPGIDADCGGGCSCGTCHVFVDPAWTTRVGGRNSLEDATIEFAFGVAPNSLAVNSWVGTLQYVPAVAGGIFGLLGGYLTDLLGRRRVLVWSILLYAVATVFAGLATSVQELLFWRCCTFIGVCVEFVAAVAWLAELFSDPKQRERVIGYTQAFGSIGGVMVTGAYYLVVTYGPSLPELRGGHEIH